MCCGSKVVHCFSLICCVLLHVEASLPFALNGVLAPSEISDAAGRGGGRNLLDNTTSHLNGFNKTDDGSAGGYDCPDVQDFVGAMNDLRILHAAPPVNWSSRLANEVVQLLNNFSLHTSCDGNAWSSGLGALTVNQDLLITNFTDGPLQWACVEAVGHYFSPIRRLLGFVGLADLSGDASLLSELGSMGGMMFGAVAWNETKTVGCALGACAGMASSFYHVVCLTEPSASAKFGGNNAKLLKELQPIAEYQCPYIVTTNTSYSVLDAAAVANLSSEQLLCYHNQLPRGVPAPMEGLGQASVTLLVPCQADAPDSSEVEQCPFQQLYQGNCPARYVVTPGDTLSSIAWMFSGATAAQLCCYNNLTNNLTNCQNLQLFQEIDIPCPEDLVGTVCEHVMDSQYEDVTADTYSCPDKDASLQAINDIRHDWGLGPVQWDEHLELTVRDYLAYALRVAGPTCNLGNYYYDSQLMSASTAINWFSEPYPGLNAYNCVPGILSYSKDTFFMTNDTTHVACAVAVCSQPQPLPGSMVACMVRPNIHWMQGDSGVKSFHHSTDQCPFTRYLGSGGDLISLAEGFNVTYEEIMCLYNQVASLYVKDDTTIAIPCPSSSPVPDEYEEYEDCPSLDLMRSSCPAQYIAVPSSYDNTPAGVVSMYGSGISAAALCCFNNISDCTAPLPFGLALEVPCAAGLYKTNCEHLVGVLDGPEVGSAHRCFDANETLVAINEMRDRFHAPHLYWDADLEFTMLTLLNGYTAEYGCNANDTYALMSFLYANPQMSFNCIMAMNTIMSGVDDIPLAHPSVDMLWEGVNRMACAVSTCGNNSVSLIYCAFRPNVVYQMLGSDSTNLTQTLPPEICPKPYRMQPGDSFQSVALANHLTLEELVCYHDQIAHPTASSPLFDITIPCPGVAPRLCAAMNLSAGTCPVRFPWTPAIDLQQLSGEYNISLPALCCYNNITQQDCNETMTFGQPLEIPCRERLLIGQCADILKGVSPSPSPSPASQSGSKAAIIGVVVAVGSVLVLLLGLGLLVWARRMKRRLAKRVPLVDLLGPADTTGPQNDLRTFYMSQVMLPSGPTSSGNSGNTQVHQSLLSDFVDPGPSAAPPLDSAGSSASHSSFLVAMEDLEVAMKGGRPIQLGSGAFATVLEGTLKREGIPVALKVMKQNAERQDTMKELLQEVALLRRCQSTYVVKFYGTCFVRDSVVLVFELMAHGDLFHALRGPNGAQYRWYNRGAQLMLDIALGLEFMHNQRIVHRDMKSLNVLLTEDDRAKIGDMGMSKFMMNSLVSKDDKLGTWAYAAPEILTNSAISNKVDVYAAGVVLWEVVTGEPPVLEELRKPRVPDECRAEVVSLINQCLSVDVSARPTAKKLREMLEQMVRERENQEGDPK